MRRLLIALALVGALGWVGWQIGAKEQLAATGRPVLFELGTVDPRSLIQGDYMVLAYRVPQELEQRLGTAMPPRGELAVTVDGRGIAQDGRLFGPGDRLGPDEVLVDYHTAGWRVTVGPDSFFFQEGQAETFAQARYAELRLSPDGEALLVALHSEQGKLGD